MKTRKLARSLSLLIASLLMLSVISCATSPENNPSKTQEQTGTVNEAETQYVPDIDVKNYDCDFNIAIGGTFDEDYHVIEEADIIAGDPISDTVYERLVNVKDHIGVNVKLVDAGEWVTYASKVANTVQAGDDTYQLVMTHVYQGVTELVTSNCLYDYADLPSINLDAGYWAGDLMEELKINDKYLLGYSDFCLSQVHLITFNKDMMATYNLEEPYDLVRNKQWTLEKFTQMAGTVSRDDGDGKKTNKDTYGLAGWGWVYLIDFITSCNMKIVDSDENGNYHIAYEDNSEKMLSLIDQILNMYKAEYSFMWKSTDNENANAKLEFSEGRSLFQFMSNGGLPALREEAIRFGILPYPLYDTEQEEYKTLNWNGLLCIPGAIKNEEMVSDTLELLNYYSAPVRTAYYEQLLGSKLANAPDDVEMLDIIWDTQTSDIGIVFCNSSPQMDTLVYMIPKMCEAGNNSFSSFIKQNKTAAQKGLDAVFLP